MADGGSHKPAAPDYPADAAHNEDGPESRQRLAKGIEDGLARDRGRKNRTLPVMAAIFGAEEVTAQKSKVPDAIYAFQIRRGVVLQQGPSVAAADNGAVAQLHHTRIL